MLQAVEATILNLFAVKVKEMRLQGEAFLLLTFHSNLTIMYHHHQHHHHQ
jgi:hypothetical protein